MGNVMALLLKFVRQDPTLLPLVLKVVSNPDVIALVEKLAHLATEKDAK